MTLSDGHWSSRSIFVLELANKFGSDSELIFTRFDQAAQCLFNLLEVIGQFAMATLVKRTQPVETLGDSGPLYKVLLSQALNNRHDCLHEADVC